MGILSGVFRGKKGLDVEKRFEPLSKPIAGSSGTYQHVRDRKTEEEFGIKILDADKVAQSRSKSKGLELPTEAEITGTFNSKNIVKLVESGQTVSGEEYLLLEHCHGIRLDEAIKLAYARSYKPKSSLLVEMIRAVSVVHEFGFLHRDICPRNYFLDLKSDSVKLFDFGNSLPNKPEFLQTGNRSGTPQYAAPEIVRRRPYDHRADIFSLGVSMFELISGKHPWEGSSSALAFDTTQPESLKNLCPHLDDKISETIHRCILPKPDDRFSSIKQVQFAIGRVLK